jgi:hypothetical protein
LLRRWKNRLRQNRRRSMGLKRRLQNRRPRFQNRWLILSSNSRSRFKYRMKYRVLVIRLDSLRWQWLKYRSSWLWLKRGLRNDGDLR